LESIFDDSRERYPQRPCIDFLGRRYTYGEIGDQVDRAAKGLQALGVEKGSRVGLLMPNCPYYVICYFAILKAGATVVNYNPLYAAPQISNQIRDSGTTYMITVDIAGTYDKAVSAFGHSPLEQIVVCSMRKALPLGESLMLSVLRRRDVAEIPDDGRHTTFEALIANDSTYNPIEIDPRTDVAVLQYTGGTSGLPRAAKLSHANLFANCVQTEMWAIGTKYGEERILAVLPFSHAFGMSAVMNVGIVLGAELIILPHFRIEEVLDVITKKKPTVFIGVPTMFASIVACKNIEKYDLSSLVHCIAGGASLAPRILKSFETLTHCRLVEGYGLTEAGPVVTANPFRGENRVGSVGLPLPSTLIEIVDPGDRVTAMPLGERGEICVTGPQVMAGYLARPDDNAMALIGGRLHTGDIGYFDGDGYLYVVDRIKDLIQTGGFNVYPGTVEAAIRDHPGVSDAVVYGSPDELHGETVMAVVILSPGASATENDIRDFLAGKIAAFEIPRIFEFRSEIPAILLGKDSGNDAAISPTSMMEAE
jgi:long-chain acyl-CoA synthetase